MTRAPILVHPEQAADLKVEVEIVEEPVVLPPLCEATMAALAEDLRDLSPELSPESEERLFQAAAQAEPPPPPCCLYHDTNGPRAAACSPELVRLLDEKWLPLLEPYLNVEQQHEFRTDILTAAVEKS